MTQDQRAKRADSIVRLYREGWSLAEIASAVGRSRERVRQILVERGEVRRPSGISPEQRAERARMLREMMEV